MSKRWFAVLMFALLLETFSSVFAVQEEEADTIRFAVISDYGKAGSSEEAVAEMVLSWEPDFIITNGDNNYNHGEASTIAQNIGQYYHSYNFPYLGEYGEGVADAARWTDTDLISGWQLSVRRESRAEGNGVRWMGLDYLVSVGGE